MWVWRLFHSWIHRAHVIRILTGIRIEFRWIEIRCMWRRCRPPHGSGGDEVVDVGDEGSDPALGRLKEERCYLAPTPVTREVEEGEIGR